MKKYLKLFVIFLTFFVYFDNVNAAKSIVDVACEYSVYNVVGNYMTDIRVEILNYNNGNGGNIVVYYKNASGSMVKYDGPTWDWLNYGKTDSYSAAMLRIFTTDKKGTSYISNYKKIGQCPSIYSNVSYDASTIDVENHVIDQENIISTSKELKSKNEQLRGDDGKWKSREDFFKDSGSGVKDDLVCSYNMYFDMYKINSPVEFITMYNPSNGAKSYRITVNGSGYSYSNLKDDVALSLGQGSSNLVYITSEQLNKIFLEDKCLEKNKIFHYYDMAHSRYNITTDQNEAADNGAGGRYDNGDGSNDGNGGSVGTGPSAPDISIIDKPMTCEEILGEGSKLIKLGINVLRIAGVIIALLNGMMAFIPAVSSGDKGELNKAFKKCIDMAIILILIVLIPELINVIGNLFGWDTSCIF